MGSLTAGQWTFIGTLVTALVTITVTVITTLRQRGGEQLKSIDTRIDEAFEAKDSLIEQYRSEVARLRTDIEILTSKVSALSSEVASLRLMELENERLKRELTEAKATIARLEKGTF
jgi:peptidoglycan hydrolase CwlO-like protein